MAVPKFVSKFCQYMWNHRIANECFKVSRDCFGSKNRRAFKKIRNAGFTSESDNDLGKLWYQICDTTIKSSAIEHYSSDIFYISKNLKVKTKVKYISILKFRKFL